MKVCSIVRVSWWDAQTVPHYHGGSTPTPIYTTSVGFLVAGDEAALTLAQSSYLPTPTSPGCVAALLIIPRGTIAKVEHLDGSVLVDMEEE